MAKNPQSLNTKIRRKFSCYWVFLYLPGLEFSHLLLKLLRMQLLKRIPRDMNHSAARGILFLYSALLNAFSANLNSLPPQKDVIELNFMPICQSRDAKLYISIHILPQCSTVMIICKILQDIDVEISDRTGAENLAFLQTTTTCCRDRHQLEMVPLIQAMWRQIQSSLQKAFRHVGIMTGT